MRPAEVVHRAAGYLERHDVQSPVPTAEALLARVLGLTRTELYTRETGLSSAEARTFGRALCLRCTGTPLQHLTGEQGFRHLVLAVEPGVFVPRPETEIVVEHALSAVEDLAAPVVIDVGTGTGAIALAIADEHDGAQIVAVDSSEQALSLARENQARAGVNGRVRLVRGDLLSDVEGPFDLVVSNPPYVSPEEYKALQPEIRLYEPYEAVVGVDIGVKVAAEARALLVPGGRLVLECGDGQAAGLTEALQSLGYGQVVETSDLAGRDRVVEGSWDAS